MFELFPIFSCSAKIIGAFGVVHTFEFHKKWSWRASLNHPFLSLSLSFSLRPIVIDGSNVAFAHCEATRSGREARTELDPGDTKSGASSAGHFLFTDIFFAS